MSTAPAAPALSEYEVLQQAERDRVTEGFSGLRQGLQTSIHKRGMGRSGFAAEQMSMLGAQEGGALADVEAGVTSSLSAYKAQQAQLDLQRKMERKARKRAKKRKRLGAALGAAGLLLAIPTGGASLGLTAAGAGMYGS